MSDTKTIRVFLVLDPSTYVDVKTTEANVRAKLQGIRKDISYQKFQRWAPFADLPQATTDGRGNYVAVPSWAWKFV
jgi:hypothetical protein